MGSLAYFSVSVPVSAAAAAVVVGCCCCWYCIQLSNYQASTEKTQGDNPEVGYEALWAPTCKQALIVGLGLVTLQQVQESRYGVVYCRM